MKTADYDFELPEHLIAERPAEQRDASRLLVVHPKEGIEHALFSDLPGFLHQGDMLVVNKSKVYPARLKGIRSDGSPIEILLVEENPDGSWKIMTKGRYSGRVVIDGRVHGELKSGKTAVFDSDIRSFAWEAGRMPLPPYIRREATEFDKERYQTIYAETEGSIAAPTAGLHFTNELLCRLETAGVIIRSVVLHVGIGTFRPVKTERLDRHVMESEQFEFGAGLPEEITRVKHAGGRVIAVGTTTTRTLEGYFSGRSDISGTNGVISGRTDIFIHEGYRPRAVDALITNFHLPRSTPLMLASVFSERKRLLEIYREAISMGYRFFSYGDAMLCL